MEVHSDGRCCYMRSTSFHITLTFITYSRLQSPAPWIAGSAFWYAPLPIDSPWFANVTCISSPDAQGGADGFALVLQNDLRGVAAVSTGGAGTALGVSSGM